MEDEDEDEESVDDSDEEDDNNGDHGEAKVDWITRRIDVLIANGCQVYFCSVS